MKIRILSAALCVAILPSCTTASGTASGDWSYFSLGTDTSELDMSGQGLRAAAVNQSAGLQATLTMVKTIWQSYLALEGIKYIADQYYDVKGAKVAASKALGLERLRNAKSAQQSAAALESLKVTTAAEGGIFVLP